MFLFISASTMIVQEIMEKLKAFLAILLFVAGFVGFYWFPSEQVVMRVAMLLGGTISAVVLWRFSASGQRFFAYVKEAIKEARKVVWPNRKETWQTTAMVFMFVAVLSLFMWLVDSGLSWTMYGLLLGQ